MKLSRYLFLAIILIAGAARAATFVVPDDRAMVRRADAIVVGQALNSYTQLDAKGTIETVTNVSIEEVIKGNLEVATIEVHEPGGRFGERSLLIPGAPHFRDGDRVVLFLLRTPQQTWAALDFVLGKFAFARDKFGQSLLVREESEIDGWDPNGAEHVERRRAADRFVQFLRTEGKGGVGREDYFVKTTALRIQDQALVAAPAAIFAPSTYTMDCGNGTGCRWNVFPSAVNWVNQNTESGAPNGGIDAFTQGLAAWTNDAGSNVNYAYVGSDAGATGGIDTPDGRNAIKFDTDLSPHGAPPFACGSGGTIALGGITSASGSHTHPVSGETFFTTKEGDVVGNKGLSGCTSFLTSESFRTALTHEIGHTLSFRHSNQDRNNGPCPATIECSSSAVMNSVVVSGLNGQLQAWDIHAVDAVYPGSGSPPPPPPPPPPTCTAPAITTQPTSRTVNSGSSTTLTAAASGTTPISWQWYTGVSGVAQTPVSGATSSSLTVTPGFTTSYFAVASNACGSVATINAIVTVRGGSTAGASSVKVMPVSSTAWRMVGAGDFSGDGWNDILFQNTSTGQLVVWFMRGGAFISSNSLPTVSNTTWHVVAVADFDRNGSPDILFYNTSSRQLVVWLMNRMTVVSNSNFLPTVSSSTWRVVGAGDFNHDGWNDILFQHTSGQMVVWTLNGLTVTSNSNFLPTVSNTAWQASAVADFDNNGSADIVFRNSGNGQNVIWLMNGFTPISNSNFIPSLTDLNWRMVTAADFDKNGTPDILWQNGSTGESAIWLMSGVNQISP